MTVPVTEERRLVTVLFADVSNSTGLGESLDPEDLRALLGRYYEIARDVVTSHGGTVEKFIGDAVMAIFGLPTAHGDDSARALSAAVELRDRVRADPRLGELLPIRVGVNSGEVVATRDQNAGDFLVTGDAVNAAARLQQAGQPWQILVGARTANVARGFRFGPATSLEAKGKAQPLSAFELLERGQEERTRVPLVGRAGELAQLQLVAQRAFGEQRPFLVSVIAPAGTGKTRLLEEFLRHLHDTVPTAHVAIAQCLPYGERLTYWPLRQMLFGLVGLADDSPAAAVRDAILSWLATNGVPEPEQVMSPLAATVGAGESDIPDRNAVFAAWRTALEAAAGRSPLVLVFEDLHWSSESLLDLVEYVMQPRADVPALMVALARPELLDRRPGWGGGRRNYVSLALEPLAEDAVGELVAHLLESPAPEVVAAIVARSEGNPFFAEELVRAVVERAGPRPGPGDAERALAALPDTVQATVLARLDALAAPERRVIQLGSVFGRTFEPSGIGAVEPALEAQAGDLVEALVEREMLRPTGRNRYTFRHILIRDVAYGTLPRSERARFHASAGAWLEGRIANEQGPYAELIAYHYREAASLGRTLNAADESIDAKAVHWLRQAADAAMAGAANVEAFRHLHNAIPLAQPEALPELHERLGDTSVAGDAAVRAYETAYQLGEEAGDPVADSFRRLSKLLMFELRFRGAYGHARSVEVIRDQIATARRLVPEVDDDAAKARFFTALAFLTWWARAEGQPVDEAMVREAHASGLAAVALADRIENPELRSAARDALGSLAMDRGEWELCRRFAEERLAFADRLEFVERLDAYAVKAWTCTVLGGLDEAERTTAAGLATIQPGQAPNWVLHLVTWRTYALTLQGRWDEATATSERAREAWIAGGRIAAGYSQHGFIPAFDVALARRDAIRIEQWREIVREISAQFPVVDGPRQRHLQHVALDTARLAESLNGPLNPSNLVGYERSLALCADFRQSVDRDAIARLLALGEKARGVVMEGQARRVLAIVSRDAREADRARGLFGRCGAVPYEARARCEAALLSADISALQEGMTTLESLGDVEQLERYARWAEERP